MNNASIRLKAHTKALRKKGNRVRRRKSVYIISNQGNKKRVLRFGVQLIPERLVGLILKGSQLAFKHKYRASLRALSKKYVQGKQIKKFTQTDITGKIPRLLAQLHKRKFNSHKFGKLGKARKRGSFSDAFISSAQRTLQTALFKIPAEYAEEFKELIAAAQRISQTDREMNERHDFSLINRDISFENIVIQKNGKIRIIDYGASGIGDPAEDLARTCSKLKLSEEQTTTLIDAYIKLTGDRRIRKRTQLYLAVEEVRKATTRYSGDNSRLIQGIAKAKRALTKAK